jgi:fructose-1,6-bisphosphatase/inositol monophosphatase family enzyme
MTEFEATVLAAHRSDAPLAAGLDPQRLGDWTAFCLRAALHAGRTIRSFRMRPLAEQVVLKSDGTPATSWETEVEQDLRTQLAVFAPGATLVGEETGGTVPTRGMALAVDPVDGTWALLGRTASLSTAIVALRDGQPFAAVVLNPATSTAVYCGHQLPSRLLHVGSLGALDLSRAVPIDIFSTGTLVNLHPSRNGGALARALHAAWVGGEIQMVRSPGGSPSWALVDSAKGGFIYVNRWGPGPTSAYDLAAAVLIVRRAGGDVVDSANRPIEALTHTGPFISGIDAQARADVAGIVAASMR